MDGKAFIKNAAKFCVAPIASTLIAVTVIPLVSRVYPAAEYGYIINFYTLGNMLMYMFLLGVDGAFARFYYEPLGGTTNGQRCTFSILVGVGVTIIAGLAVFALCPEKVSYLLFDDLDTTGLLLLFVYVASLIVFTLINLSVRFDENARDYNIQQVMLLVSTRLVFVVAAIVSVRYIYSVAVMTACTVFMTCLVALKNKDKLMNSPFIPSEVIKTFLIFALPIMPTTVFVQLNSSIARLLLGAFEFRNEVGVLALATSVANVFTILPKVFTTYWGPFVYKYYKTEHQLIKTIHNAMMIISLFLVVGIMIFQDLLFGIVGSDYLSSQKYFMLIMLAPVSVLVAETTNYGVTIANKPVINLVISIIVCFVNALVCYLLIPLYGEMGAVIGIASAAITYGALRTMAGQHFYSVIDKPYQTILTSLLIVGMCTANLFVWDSKTLQVLICFLSIVICVAVYNKDVSHILRSIIRKKEPSL